MGASGPLRGSPVVARRSTPDPLDGRRPLVRCQLKDSRRLWRLLELRIDGAVHLLEYQGAGMGFEEVRVDGEVAVQKRSFVWFVPRFEFAVAGHPALLEVRVGWLLKISALRLRVDSWPVYTEGSWPAV